MASEIIKMDVSFDDERVNELIPGFDKAKHGPALVGKVTDLMDLHSETGGWIWKITYPQAGGVKLVGRFVPVGAAVVG